MYLAIFKLGILVKNWFPNYVISSFFIYFWKVIYKKVDFFKHFYKYACYFFLFKISLKLRQRFKIVDKVKSFIFTESRFFNRVKKKKKKTRSLKFVTTNQVLTNQRFFIASFINNREIFVSYFTWFFSKKLPFFKFYSLYVTLVKKKNDIQKRQESITIINRLNRFKTLFFLYLKTRSVFTWFLLLNFLPVNCLLHLNPNKNKQSSYTLTTMLKRNKNVVTSSLYAYLMLGYTSITNTIFIDKNILNYIYFYNKYILNYLESLFNIKTCINCYSYVAFSYLLKQVQDALALCLFPVLKKFNKKFFINDFIYVLSIMFLQKNCLVFIRWLIRFIEKIHIRLHKKFFFLLKLYFKRVFSSQANFLDYKGFKLVLRGKISSAGNSKKKIFKFSHGICSLTKKNSKINYCYKIIRTYTGALGLKVFLFY